jgi:hypothetical protein
VSHRPLVFVSGLTVGDYLLWDWSSSANHEVIALLSGLTLLPLLLAMLAMLTLTIARAIAGRALRPSARRLQGGAVARSAGERAKAAGQTLTETPARAGVADAPSRRIAA